MNLPECNICHMDLDEEEHQPLHLGCSHDACTACVKDLINNGSLMCPMCRTVVNANAPEDLKINHGVVQILRMLKEFKVSENKIEKEEIRPRNTEICRIHKQSLDIRCVSCKLWICVQCKQTHTPDIGCEVQDYNTYLKNLKEEHMQRTEPTLVSMRMNLKSYSSQISQIEKEIFQIEIEKKKLEEKHKNLLKVVEEGSNTLNEVETATADIEKASTLMELNEKVNIFNELQQFAGLWCKKNPGSHFELLRSGEEEYVTMDINNKSFSGKMLIEKGNMYLHCLRINESNFNKSSKVYPYNEVMNLLPSIRDLVFLDLAIGGTVKGRVIIRIRQDLPNYAENFPILCHGEEGHSLLNLKFNQCWESHLWLPFSYNSAAMKKFKRDSNAGHKVVPGSVLAHYENSAFTDLFIHLEQGIYSYNNCWEVFGQVESGLDILKLCRSHHNQTEVSVADSGIVFKEETVVNRMFTNAGMPEACVYL